jgi:selenocysteine lyase/cysteine desulfurase
LIGAAPEDVALISSVSYGIATAGKVFAPPAGTRVLVLQDDQSSPVLEWMARAPAQGFTIDTVQRPADGDWTAALEDAIARPGAPVSLASISNVHWSDGGVIDLLRIAPMLRSQGAALLVDATHGAGVMSIDVGTIDPDFLIFPTYKWVLGPYGRAFLYVAKRWQDGVPLEQTPFGRKSVSSERVPYFADLAYAPTARRFDMGERDHFIGLDMAATGMEMMAGWGQAAIAERCAMLTARRELEDMSATELLEDADLEAAVRAVLPGESAEAKREATTRLVAKYGGGDAAAWALRRCFDGLLLARENPSLGRAMPSARLLWAEPSRPRGGEAEASSCCVLA